MHSRRHGSPTTDWMRACAGDVGDMEAGARDVRDFCEPVLLAGTSWGCTEPTLARCSETENRSTRDQPLQERPNGQREAYGRRLHWTRQRDMQQRSIGKCSCTLETSSTTDDVSSSHEVVGHSMLVGGRRGLASLPFRPPWVSHRKTRRSACSKP